MPLCACGCEQEIKEGNKFMVGHSRRGIPMGNDHKRKIGLSNSISKKGKPNGLKGIPKSEEHKRKLSEYHKGKHLSDETKLKISLKGRGRIVSEETKNKISLCRKGKKMEDIYGEEKSKKIKKQLSQIKKGESNPFYGKHHTDEIKKQISLKHLDMDFYLKHGYAKSKEPYGNGFSKEVKENIAKRDSFTCQICNELIPNLYAIHHIDYDKKNSNENNLIFLCRSCHSKTNHNREFWKSYLMEGDVVRTSF